MTGGHKGLTELASYFVWQKSNSSYGEVIKCGGHGLHGEPTNDCKLPYNLLVHNNLSNQGHHISHIKAMKVNILVASFSL